MRPDCERCGCDLRPDEGRALICSFECTFCENCVEGPLAGTCPNCGGEFAKRPTRVGAMLERHPASTVRKSPA